MIVARWIGLGPVEQPRIEAVWRGLAASQSRDAAPIFLWGQAKTDLWLGQAGGLADPDRLSVVTFGSCPGGLLAVAQGCQLFILIVPRRIAPGRSSRWLAWALSPMLATCRQLGLPACLEGDEIRLHGRRIAASGTCRLGECAVIASALLPCFDAAAADAPTHAFRSQMRAKLALAQSEWADASPPGRVLEDLFRQRVAAQFGWQFEHSWASRAESAAIEQLRGEAAVEGV